MADWKAFFAEQVVLMAKELASNSDMPRLVTLDHYRNAAILAAQALTIEVQQATGANYGGKKAA